MDEEEKNKGGRPPMTPEERQAKANEMSQKLEPYLKSGLSIRKAVGEAQISKSDFYRMMDEDEGFRDKINQFRDFVSVLANNIIVKELQTIIEKQNGNQEKKIPPKALNKDDRNFVWKFVLTSNLTKDEFGERKSVELFDPEAEIQKVKGIIEESSTTEIDHGTE